VIHHETIVVVAIHLKRGSQLLKIIDASNAFGFFSGFVECRQQHTGEYRYDSYNNEQLDKCKT
jgi:hypothetical protein